MPNIEVSNHVKEELNDIKTAEEHKSYDSVLRMLLASYQR